MFLFYKTLLKHKHSFHNIVSISYHSNPSQAQLKTIMNQFIGKNFRLNGNQLASRISLTIKKNIQQFISTNQHYFNKPIPRPKLQIINVGHNIGSLSYIRKKMQTAQQIGIGYHLHQFNVCVSKQTYDKDYTEVDAVLARMNQQKYNKYEISLQQLGEIANLQQASKIKLEILQQTVEPLINKLNSDTSTSALFIQLPLPDSLKPFTQHLVNTISPLKDADCLTRKNRMLVLDHKLIPQLLPCTPRGVLKILDQNNISIEGMNAVVIGRSDLVGKPLSHLLLNRSATTTVCHKLTKDVNFFTKDADLVISAAGVPNLVKTVKPGAVLIDVGISRNQSGKLSGDISNEAKSKASFYTPVPGGVGPMTVVMLMENVYVLWRKQLLQQLSENKHQSIS